MARLIKETKKGSFSKDTKLIDDLDSLNALSNRTRLDILEELSKNADYPSNLAKNLGISEQNIHYHIKMMESRGIIEKVTEEFRGGSLAKFYRPSADSFAYEIPGTKELPVDNRFVQEYENLKNFFMPFISDGTLDMKIAVGSPDPHGPNQVRGRDGHLAIDLACKLGNLGHFDASKVVLDTEIDILEEDNNLVLVGGPLTNLLTSKINGYLPVRFDMEKFPYRAITSRRTGETYHEASIGVINKIRHPSYDDNFIVVVAGIRNKGTRAAVKGLAEKNEKILRDYDKEEHWGRIVMGQDLDGDGRIDDVKVVE